MTEASRKSRSQALEAQRAANASAMEKGVLGAAGFA